MSAFKALKDASRNLEEELQRVSNELFSAKIGETYENNVVKKLRDLSLYQAKLRFLRAKPLSLTSQVSEHGRDEDATLEAYGETVVTRIIEQQLVKSATQAQAVRNLVIAPDSTLDPKMVERKQKILSALSEYRFEEAAVQQFDSRLKEKEARLAEVRELWDRELGQLRDLRQERTVHDTDINDLLYKKLSSTVEKLELMRWLANRLCAPRSDGYDWLADSHRRLAAIKVARAPYSVERFLENS